LATQEAAGKRRRILIEAAQTKNDTNILELKNNYRDIHEKLPRGAWAKDSRWLTSKIQNAFATQSTPTPDGDTLAPKATISANNILPIFGRSVNAGSTMIQVAD
jgi:hypothetical protein